MDVTTKKNIRKKLWFWAALVSSWLTFAFFFVSPFGFIFWCIALVILFKRKSKLKWYLIIFSAWLAVPILSFCFATKDYFSGEATFKSIGMPNLEFYNLDEKYRAWNSTSGCIVVGYEPFTHVPNNWAIEFWTNMLGFQKGVYTGVYPSITEASNLIGSYPEKINFTKGEMFLDFEISGKRYSLKDARSNFQNLDSCTTANAALIDDQLILFKPICTEKESIIYLADSKTGEIFARYYEDIE